MKAGNPVTKVVNPVTLVTKNTERKPVKLLEDISSFIHSINIY